MPTSPMGAPANPDDVGSYGGGEKEGVAVEGDYAYVTDDSSRLEVVDIGDPTTPTEVGFYSTAGHSYGVAKEGDYVYVASGTGGLYIICSRCVTSAVIPSGGGTFNACGNYTYTFSSGAFTATVVVTHTTRFASDAGLPSTGELVGINRFFEVTAVYSSTGQPAQPAPGETYTVTVRYTDAERGAAIEDTLMMYWWDGNAWSQAGVTSTVDITGNNVTARIDHLSLFGVQGETRRVYLPLTMRKNTP